MNFLVSEVVTYLSLFVLPFARVSAFMLAAPIFSLQAFNVRFRVLFSAILTFAVVELITFDTQGLAFVELMTLVIMQIFVGVFAGFLLQIVNGAVAVGGTPDHEIARFLRDSPAHFPDRPRPEARPAHDTDRWLQARAAPKAGVWGRNWIVGRCRCQ